MKGSLDRFLKRKQQYVCSLIGDGCSLVNSFANEPQNAFFVGNDWNPLSHELGNVLVGQEVAEEFASFQAKGTEAFANRRQAYLQRSNYGFCVNGNALRAAGNLQQILAKKSLDF